jgi:hypothetical protein
MIKTYFRPLQLSTWFIYWLYFEIPRASDLSEVGRTELVNIRIGNWLAMVDALLGSVFAGLDIAWILIEQFQDIASPSICMCCRSRGALGVMLYHAVVVASLLISPGEVHALMICFCFCFCSCFGSCVLRLDCIDFPRVAPGPQTSFPPIKYHILYNNSPRHLRTKEMDDGGTGLPCNPRCMEERPRTSFLCLSPIGAELVSESGDSIEARQAGR